jgi:hypothetical protein
MVFGRVYAKNFRILPESAHKKPARVNFGHIQLNSTENQAMAGCQFEKFSGNFGGSLVKNRGRI